MNTTKHQIALARKLEKECRKYEQVGLYIVVHRNNPNDKRQPHIKESDIFKILEISETETGIKMLKCQKRNSDRICNINADRFNWSIYTPQAIKEVEKCICLMYMEELQECQKKEAEAEKERLKKEDEETARIMRDSFTDAELIQINFVHLVIAELCWQEADQTTIVAGRLNAEQTKELCRAFRKLRNDYDKSLQKNRKGMDDRGIKRNAKEFSLNSRFMDLYSFAKKEIKKLYEAQHPELDTFKDLRYHAQLGKLMIEVYSRQIDRINAMIDARIGNDNKYDSQKNIVITDALNEFFDAMQGEYTLKPCDELETIVKTWCNMVENAEFVCTGVNR